MISLEEKENNGIIYFWNGMKNLWELFENEKKNIIIIFLIMVFLRITDLIFPYFLKLVIDEFPTVMELGKFNNYFIFLLFGMLFVKIFSVYVKRFFMEIKFLKTLINLENYWPVKAQKKLLDLSLDFHEQENTGKKIEKINKGCDRLVDVLGMLYWRLLPQFLFLIFNLGIIIILDWKIGLVYCIPFIPAALINISYNKKVASGWSEWHLKKEISVGMFCQSIINVSTVKNYVQEKNEQDQLFGVRDKMRKIDIGIHELAQKYYFATGVLLNSFFVFTVCLSLYFVLKGTSTMGTLAFIIYTGGATLDSLWSIIHDYNEILRRLIAVNRMKELLEEKISIKNCQNAVIPENYRGEFEFKNVNFKYPRKNNFILKNFNMKVEPGKMTAIIGRTGEGKTTVFKAICRMYDIDSGDLTLDGVDIRKLDLAWYRKNFAIVQQEVGIFDKSLLENIRYSYREANEEQVEMAIKAAHLDVMIKNKEKFPDGLNTVLGERGVLLSGGEKQRVEIARAYLALMRGARVLILDEATSHLDSEAENVIQKMVDNVRKNKNISIIAVAHRLSTIKKSDMIYVINNGSVEEKGDHQRLLARNGLYSKLVELQKIGEIRE